MHELIQDSIILLQGELSPVTGIVVDLRPQHLLPMAELLSTTSLSYTRQTRLLSLYLAIKLATQRHDEWHVSAHGLTRSVLDGDYLYSFYLQLALKWGEYDYVSTMASYIKRLQIERAEGLPECELLLKGSAEFLRLETKKQRVAAKAKAKAI